MSMPKILFLMLILALLKMTIYYIIKANIFGLFFAIDIQKQLKRGKIFVSKWEKSASY